MSRNGTTIGMTPPHPGYFIRVEIVEELGLTVTETAEILGVPRDTLSAFLNEETRLSPEMALRMEKAFDVDMDMMLRWQAWRDVATMRRLADEIVVERYAGLDTG